MFSGFNGLNIRMARHWEGKIWSILDYERCLVDVE